MLRNRIPRMLEGDILWPPRWSFFPPVNQEILPQADQHGAYCLEVEGGLGAVVELWLRLVQGVMVPLCSSSRMRKLLLLHLPFCLPPGHKVHQSSWWHTQRHMEPPFFGGLGALMWWHRFFFSHLLTAFCLMPWLNFLAEMRRPSSEIFLAEKRMISYEKRVPFYYTAKDHFKQFLRTKPITFSQLTANQIALNHIFTPLLIIEDVTFATHSHHFFTLHFLSSWRRHVWKKETPLWCSESEQTRKASQKFMPNERGRLLQVLKRLVSN